MKKLLIAIAAAATAIGTYAATAIGGAQFEKGDTAYTWTQTGEEEGVFADGFWAIPTDATTTWTAGDCGFLDATKRPAGYDELGRQGYMAIKTTFGNPIAQNTKASGASVIDAGLYYDGLVKFTACDETPDLAATAYEDAKIGFFPLLESDEDGADAYLYIWSAGGTNLWKTTKTIDDGWHRVTIKMIENVNRPGATAQVGFVVFIDGKAVNCTAAKDVFTAADLDPAVREKWYNNGQLFASMTDSTEVTGVLYDGQGAIDEVGFVDATDAPAFAADDTYGTLTWTSANITTVYVIDDEGNDVTSGIASPIDFLMDSEKSYKYYYDAAPGYVSVSKANAIAFDGTKKVNEIEAPEPCAASVTINEVTTQYGDMADAVKAVEAAEEATLTLQRNFEGELYIQTEGTLELTLDLNGWNITAGVSAQDAICFDAGVTATITNSKEIGGTVDGGSSGYAVSAQNADFLKIEAGTYIGTVDATDAEYAAITGGKFSIEGNNAGGECTLVAPDGYKFVEGEDEDEGYWVLAEDLSVAVTFADGKNCTVTKVNGEDYAGTELKFEKGDTAKVTYEAAKGFTFQDGTEVTVDVEITAAGEIPAKVSAFAAVAKVGEKFYPSVEAAYEAADAGDTLYLVADSQLEGMLKIEKNLTIDATDDYTLTGPSGAYGLVIAANVTLKGGTIKELETESRSIVNVGNPAGGDFGAEAFVGNLVIDGATIKGAGAGTKSGNAIAAANGTVTITSGTITDIGARGVKAEGTATITINGGTIESNDGYPGTVKPALYVKEHGSITVNGGTIDGVIKNDATSTATITIPGTSKATFDRDQSTFCAPGYKTFENGDGRWEVKAAKEVTITAGEGIASVMADEKDLTGAIKIQPTDLDTDVTLTADEAIKTPVFKIAVNGADPVEVTSPFKLSSYITYDVIVEGATVVFTAEEGAAPIEPVDPQEPITGKTVEEVNAALDQYLKVPEGVTDAGTYRAMFEAKAGATEGTVVIDLKSDVAKEIADQLANEETSGSMLNPDATTSEVTITAKPGLFYGIKAVDSLTGIATAEGQNWVQATGNTVSVKVPEVTGDKAFFQPVCSAVEQK